MLRLYLQMSSHYMNIYLLVHSREHYNWLTAILLAVQLWRFTVNHSVQQYESHDLEMAYVPSDLYSTRLS